MADYDFSSLNSSDLEEMVCDLINAQEKFKNTGIKLRTFKDGKDKGIDLLFASSSNPYEIVGQVKHYYKSSIEELLRNLKKDEVLKAINLKPGMYIFAPSLDLSAQSADELVKVFYPFLSKYRFFYSAFL